jgi:hypothetical protein
MITKDRQAAGVLATEAFYLAGDLGAFSEQILPAGNADKNMSLSQATAPEPKRPGWQSFIVSAQFDSQNIGVELSTGWLAPQ